MEASQSGAPEGQDQAGQAPEGQDQGQGDSPQSVNDGTQQGGPEPTGDASGGEAVPPEGEGSDELTSDERNPAQDQAPVATEHQEAVIGDPGLRDEQQPVQGEGAPTSVNAPHRTSAPPPEAQSGVPLPEDRAAGVQPGEPVPTPDAPDVGGAPAEETPAEEGQGEE